MPIPIPRLVPRRMLWPDQPIDRGLLGEWIATGRAGNVPDTSEYNNSGVLSANAAWTPTTQGPAVIFDGDTDKCDCGNDVLLNPTSAITVEALICADVSEAWSIIASKWDDGGGVGDKFFFHFAVNWSDLSLYISPDGQNVGAELARDPNALTLGQWYHVAFTASCDTDDVLLYRDGQEVDSGVYAPANFPSITQPLCIGAKDNADASSFNGKIRLVRMYERDLLPSEIARRAEIAKGQQMQPMWVTMPAVAVVGVPRQMDYYRRRRVA